MTLWQYIEQQIGQYSGEPFSASTRHSVGGGCINDAWRLADGQRCFFVKLNDAGQLAMFEAEADGLRELAAARAIRVPEPLVSGVADGQAFLVMEDLELGGSGAEIRPAARLGEQLAALHRHYGERFGWVRDNTIGATPQINTESDNWPAFWREQRLGFQLQLAARNGYGGRLQQLGEQLQARLGGLFDGHSPQPSLLHGDLWGGNWAVCHDGEPAIFDPACYYGDREADIAMTELFGGFGSDFYAAYNAAWPLEAGYPVRKTLYNLYHIINHLNLFGGGYGSQAEGMMQRLLAELR